MGINRNAFGKLMRMLAQYEDAPSAVIREYVSNAIDAIHGMDNGHVDIIIPSQDNHEFQVKDNGRGMSYEFMDNELCNYLSSTKTNSGDSIGSKGIGSKAAFSISDEFSIISVQNGTKTTCVYHINDDDECGYDISSEDTNESNGTLVSININGDDNVTRMYSGISHVLKGFPQGVITVKTHDGDEIHIDYFEAPSRVKLNDTVSINTSRSAGFVIIQGNVWYDITRSSLHDLISRIFSSDRSDYDPSLEKKISVIKRVFKMKWTYGPVFCGLVISLPGNALTTNPSRESFEATAHNREVIVDALYDMCVEVNSKNETLLDLVNKDMDNDTFRNLRYDAANEVYMSIARVLHLDYKENSDISIGGEKFVNYDISFKKSPMVFEKKKDTKSSPYSDLSDSIKSVDANGNQTYEYDVENTFKNTVSVFMSGVDDNDMAAAIIRKRRIWSEETNGIDNSCDIMRFVFTAQEDHDIPFWLNKSLKTVFTSKEEFDTIMQSRSERMKKEAAERRKSKEQTEKTVDNMKVSTIFYHGNRDVFNNSSKLLLKSISNNDNVVRMDKDEYKKLRENHANKTIERISLLMGIEDSSAFNRKDIIVVCDSGTKRDRETIHDCFDDYHDRYDELVAVAKKPMSKARHVYSDMYHDLFESEYLRITTSAINNYATYSDSIFSILNRATGIKNKKTGMLIERLDNVGNKSDRLRAKIGLNTITYVRYINSLESMDIKEDTSVERDSIEQFESDISAFQSLYPMLQLCARTLINSNGTGTGAMIDYINTCDKAREIDR